MLNFKIILIILSYLVNINWLQAEDILKKTPSTINQNIKNKYIWTSSIFFDTNSLNNLDKALNTLMQNTDKAISVKILKNNTDDIEKNFYLNTLIFQDIKHWAVWINNKKLDILNNKINDSAIEITGIKPSYVVLKWSLITSLDDMIPNWQDKLKLSNNFYTNTDQTIKYDQFNNYVEFSLSVNQTFIAKDLKIVEGNIFNI